MNRIRELRKARGLSGYDLAKLVGTTAQQISRLERGGRDGRRLTVEWMTKIARALNVTPSDLISERAMLNSQDEIADADVEHASVRTALASRGLKIYRVVTDSVSEAGYPEDTIITVDETADAINKIRTGDVVLVEVASPAGGQLRILRQIVLPRTLITNRRGTTSSFAIDDPVMEARIVGVALREHD